MNESLYTVLTIVLGSLLGVLGPVLVNHIMRPIRQAEIGNAITTELRELKEHMVLLVFILRRSLGTVDRSLLKWLADELGDCIVNREDSIEMGNTISEYLSQDDNTLDATLERDNRRNVDMPKAKGLKKFRAPYLYSKIGEIGIFGEQTCAKILDLQANLSIMDEEIDDGRLYFRYTFELADNNVNHNIAVDNLLATYGQGELRSSFHV